MTGIRDFPCDAGRPRRQPWGLGEWGIGGAAEREARRKSLFATKVRAVARALAEIEGDKHNARSLSTAPETSYGITFTLSIRNREGCLGIEMRQDMFDDLDASAIAGWLADNTEELL